MTRYKSRGATLSPQSRFLQHHTVAEPDGWEPTAGQVGESAVTGVAESGEAGAAPADDPDGTLPGRDPRTELLPDRTVKLITTNKSPDIPFDRSINPYKGCEHGCVYCFARPTHAYLDLSPGLDFETKIFFKTSVRERLEAELGSRRYLCRPMAMGTNTDPYQLAEKDKRITREVLEILLACNHPVSIVTKSQLILRDLDVLAELASRQLASVHVSVTTLDRDLKRRLEPRTAGPAARLKVIRELRAAGVPAGAMIAPVIPFINDAELEDIVAACADAGAQALGYILLRLPLEVAPIFQDWLQTHYPLKASRVESAMKSMRDGKLYRSGWGQRMRGKGPFADLLEKRFRKALRRNGLEGAEMPALRTDLFRRPGAQQSLF